MNKKIRESWGIYSQKKTAVAGLFIVVLFTIVVFGAPWFAPHGPKQIVGAPFEPPSRHHWFGTNDIGCDILSEVIHAGRISMTVGCIAALLIVITGTAIGLVSGFFGGAVDEILMRMTDIVLILPRLPLMIILAAFLGPGMWTIIAVYAGVGWATLSRQVRSQVLSIRELTYIEASKAIGAGSIRTMIQHVIPGVGGIVIANGVLEIMFAILTEAGLSFLGLGDPIHESWGVMLYFAQKRGAFLLGAWWWIFPPGIAIALLCCSFNFIGTALNDLFGLKLKKG